MMLVEILVDCNLFVVPTMFLSPFANKPPDNRPGPFPWSLASMNSWVSFETPNLTVTCHCLLILVVFWGEVILFFLKQV